MPAKIESIRPVNRRPSIFPVDPHLIKASSTVAPMKVLAGLFFCLCSTSSFAQQVHVPDANFKKCLLANEQINTNMDDQIQVSEASAFEGSISCEQMDISDLTGVEAFVSLWKLKCGSNNLTSLDLSKNTDLRSLWCANNRLTHIKFSAGDKLQTVFLSGNALTNLTIPDSTGIRKLDVGFNQLTELDVSKAAKLTSLKCTGNKLTSLDVSNNAALTSLRA
jgi:hypothetical protein